MKAFNHKCSLAIGFFVVLLLVTGCQPGATTEVVVNTPTVAPEVVVESEGQCSVTDMNQIAEGTVVHEPQVGQVTRAAVMTYAIKCGNPYVTEKCIDVQDHYDEATPFHFTSLVECVTDEGGTWKGTCDSTEGKSAVCTTEGDGKYKGLQLYTNADLNTYIMKYRVTRLNKQ